MKAKLEHISTWRRLNWWWEGWRTGEGFAAVAHRHSLVYRVEQIFLIHRRTNRALLHVTEDAGLPQDSARVAKALSDIQDMARDLLFVGENSELDEFRLGEEQVWVALQARAYLAGIIRGEAPSGLRLAFQETMDRIHTEHVDELKNGSPDAGVFESARADLNSLLVSEYGPIPECPRLPHLQLPHLRLPTLRPPTLRLPTLRLPTLRLPDLRLPTLRRVWPVGVALVFLVGLLLAVPSYRKWRGEVQRAKSSANLVVEGEKSVTSSKVDAANVGTDSKQALAQFEAAFPLPPAVKATVAKETLVLAGTAPYEWISVVQEGAPKIPGISGINGDDLVVEFSPELVLKTFRQQFGIPITVDASFRDGGLFLTGEAPHSWLVQVRRGAKRLPGVQVVDDRRVVDIDQRTFHETKTEIEEAAILFVMNRDSLPEETAIRLGRTATAAQRCLQAASNMEVNVSLEVHGYGDAIATDAENKERSLRRAETVKDLLVASGVDGRKVNSLGMGTPPRPGPGEKSGAGAFDRRVFLRVVIQP